MLSRMAIFKLAISLLVITCICGSKGTFVHDLNLGYVPEIIRMIFTKDYKPPQECPNLTLQIARHHDYPTEEHYATTDDGYILRLDRIKGGRRGNFNPDRVVFLLFGATSQSMGFVANGPDKALALVLADEGFDVWIGNIRGGTGSRNHTSLDADINISYWKFSFDTVAENDIPAMINYVTRTSGVGQVYYIGYSNGGGALLMNSDTKKSVIAKIRFFAQMGNPGPRDFPEFISIFLKLFGKIWKVAESVNLGQEFAEDPLYVKVTDAFCGAGTTSKSLCTLVLNLIFNFPPFFEDLFQDQSIDLACYQRAMVGSMSIRVLAQVSQMLGSGGVLKRFNYGLVGNLKNYGSFLPPNYDLSKFTVPSYFYWTFGDPSTTQYHMENFPKAIPNLMSNNIIDDRSFKYFGFIYSNRANKLVYSDIIKAMESY